MDADLILTDDETRIITLLRGAESAARHGRPSTMERKRNEAWLLILDTYPAAFTHLGGLRVSDDGSIKGND